MPVMKKDLLTTISQRYNTVWSDFNIYDEEIFNTEIFISEIFISEKVKSIILNFSRYTGYDKKAYGIPVEIERGITEQESYNFWIVELEKKAAIFNSLLSKIGIISISQCAYDGLFLYYWFSGKLLEVHALEGVYQLKDFIIRKDWDTVSSMILRCYDYKDEAFEAARILRLAFYKRYKDRRWLRQQGIFKIRDRNELYKFNSFTEEELSRARFAYYAETKNFLPYTPEGIKRDIDKKYANTLTISFYTWDGNTTEYEIFKEPSLYPVEKIQVFVNDNLIQNYYDYTVNGTTVTLINTSNYVANSTLRFVVSI